MIEITAYSLRDNTTDLQLTADGAAVNLSSVTKMELVDRHNKVTISSATSPDVFDWSGGAGGVKIAFGEANLQLSSYTFKLIVYDPTNPDGIVWDTLTVAVEKTV
jgi:hypothetical protein